MRLVQRAPSATGATLRRLDGFSSAVLRPAALVGPLTLLLLAGLPGLIALLLLSALLAGPLPALIRLALAALSAVLLSALLLSRLSTFVRHHVTSLVEEII